MLKSSDKKVQSGRKVIKEKRLDVDDLFFDIREIEDDEPDPPPPGGRSPPPNTKTIEGTQHDKPIKLSDKAKA